MKTNDHSNHSQKLLKSKYLDKANRPTKIMLTDLCPEQKVKIGQLIKTLELRKKQNQQFQQSLMRSKQIIHQLQEKCNAIQQQLKNKQNQCQNLKRQLQKNQKYCMQRDIDFEQLKIELSKMQKKQKNLVNMFSNTDNPILVNIQLQTQFKKKKTKNKQIQVQLNQIRNQSHKTSFYRPNSKSFSKIMNQKNSSNNLQRNQHRMKIQSQKSKGQSHKKLTVQQLENFNKWQDIQDSQQQPNDNNQNLQVQDTDDDDQFQTLARKWLQLKQKNIQQIKQNCYSNSYLTKNNIRSQMEESNQNEYQQGQVQIDQIQLNKALKGRNFSASIILGSSHGSTQRQNTKNNLKSVQKYTQKSVNSEVSETKNNKKPVKHIKKVVEKQQQKILNLQKSSKDVDFYSSDLMDLVQSINP